MPQESDGTEDASNFEYMPDKKNDFQNCTISILPIWLVPSLRSKGYNIAYTGKLHVHVANCNKCRGQICGATACVATTVYMATFHLSFSIISCVSTVGASLAVYCLQNSRFK